MQILEAAGRSFSSRGFGDTPVSELAAEAGVTSGLLYYYFSSKRGLFEAVAADARRRLEERVITPILALVAPQESLEARLVTLVNVLAHRGSDDAALHRLLLASDFEAEGVTVVRTFRDAVHGDLLRLYAAIAGVDAEGPRNRREEQLLAFVELLTLGLWYFSLRPQGIERLPIAVQAFTALFDGGLFVDDDARPGPADNGHGSPKQASSTGGASTDEAGVRERIAMVALHQFAKNGFGKTSMKEIATLAGMTTGAIYYHFGSKADLHRGAGYAGTQRLAQQYATTVAGIGAERSQRQRVKTYFRAIGVNRHNHLDNHWIGVSIHIDAERYPEIAETRDAWAHDLERLYRIVTDGGSAPPEMADWDNSPLPVLLNVLTVGTSWMVVRHGPDALLPALKGLERFIDRPVAVQGRRRQPATRTRS